MVWLAQLQALQRYSVTDHARVVRSLVRSLIHDLSSANGDHGRGRGRVAADIIARTLMRSVREAKKAVYPQQQ